jgi:hypothetical protein
VNDFFGIAAAFLLFPVLAFFPGYLLAHTLNLWQFRTRTFAFQIAASVPLSLSTGPILTFFCWKFAWPAYALITAASLFVFKPKLDRTTRIAGLIALAWSLFAALWLMDWQFPTRTYFPIYALDYSTRSAMVHSLSAFGLPAQTPFFTPGHPVALHYHFLWLLQCALIHAVAPGFITARLAFIAGAIWCGIGLMCIAALAMRILMNRRSWIVIALLAITGLDIIPAAIILIANRLHLIHMLPPSAEWWNEQIDGWIYTVLWEPHYICALIACMTGLLVLWQSRRAACILIAALCFATAVGSGSFVAFVFAAFLALWLVVDFQMPLALTGILTVLFSLPYLATLRSPAQNIGGDSLLKLTIRPFSPLPFPPIANLLLLPLNYFLELGFFAACVWVGYRRKLAPRERLLLLMALVSILICTFLKSGATANNDLGWRGFLVAQFALLILSAAYLEQVRPSRFLAALMILGLLGTTYDLLLTRLFPILSDADQVPKLKWLARDDKLGERTRANRQAYEWLRQHSRETAVIGQNPDVEAADIFYGIYADRKTVAADQSCTIGFGGSASECSAAKTKLNTLRSACLAFPISFYIVKDTDAAWNSWTESPAFANQFVRIYKCQDR